MMRFLHRLLGTVVPHDTSEREAVLKASRDALLSASNDMIGEAEDLTGRLQNNYADQLQILAFDDPRWRRNRIRA